MAQGIEQNSVIESVRKQAKIVFKSDLFVQLLDEFNKKGQISQNRVTQIF